jgi:hypothetical protein
MMRVVFVADEFKPGTPVQQLLDRFLIGYPRDGTFYRPECEVILVTPESNEDIERRRKDFPLRWQREQATGDAIAIFSRDAKNIRADRCFVYGAPLPDFKAVSGTALRGAWLLPEISADDLRLDRALVVVQGTYPQAELEALDALMPLIWRALPNVRTVTHLVGNQFWEVLRRDFWPLVKSAISRSDSPQGDPVRDGRTQDIVGLGLIERLAKSPRGWLIKHEDGLQYVIAVMDGVVADYNVALQTRAGGILSAQVHRGPAPGEQHYNRLATMLEGYFRTGQPPWPFAQSAYAGQLLQQFRELSLPEASQ